jgi:predicted phosphodiesterase
MRVLIVSDIHANLSALETVLADAEQLEFLEQRGFEQVWCLGDIVGYGPDPNECVDRLRDFGSDHFAVAGNHDWAALGNLAVDDFNPEARRAVLWTREQLAHKTRTYLEGLPAEPQVQGEFTITHASPRHPVWEYVASPFVARDNFDYFDTQFCLVGHTHEPRIYQWVQEEQGRGRPARCSARAPIFDRPVDLASDERLIINPGSVGQPRDNDPRAAYALLDTEAKRIRFRRVAYPYELTQARMRSANLPGRLIARLSYGW